MKVCKFEITEYRVFKTIIIKLSGIVYLGVLQHVVVMTLL